MVMVNIPNVALNNGRLIPILGLGTWKAKPGEVKQAVIDAIDCGYRHIDCALIYGNEKEIGEALKTKMDDGTVKREELFITSKLWNAFHSRHLIVPAIRESLKNLGLNYLDLYLIHWPMGYKEGDALVPTDELGKTLYSNVDYIETWTGMEDCFHQGLAKGIGLSNFNKEQVERLLSIATVLPANNQIECHPYLNQMKLVEFCKLKGITITAYSPLGSPDRPWAKPEDPKLLDDPKVRTIAEKYGKTTAQVLIRYQIQRGIICIPKSVTRSRVESNFQVFDFELSKEDVSLINTFDCNGRFLLINWLNDHPYYPFHAEF